MTKLRLYRDLPCLHRQDDRADGFHWLELLLQHVSSCFPSSKLELGTPFLAGSTKDKDSGSQCVYCWKRMARHEREAQFIGRFWVVGCCGLFFLSQNLTIAPGDYRHQCLERACEGVLRELR